MTEIKYFNGRFRSADEVSQSKFGEINCFICETVNEDFPFRGTPTEMANDALVHLGVYSEFFPVIIYSEEGIDGKGRYTTSVTFEAVKNHF